MALLREDINTLTFIYELKKYGLTSEDISYLREMNMINEGLMDNLKKNGKNALAGLVAGTAIAAAALAPQDAERVAKEVSTKVKNSLNRVIPDTLSKYSFDFTPLFIDAAKFDARFKKYADNETLPLDNENKKIVYWDTDVLVNLAKFVRGGGSDSDLADLVYKRAEANFNSGGTPPLLPR